MAHFRNRWHKVPALSGQACDSFLREKKITLDSGQLIQYKLTTAESIPLMQHICSLFTSSQSDKHNFL